MKMTCKHCRRDFDILAEDTVLIDNGRNLLLAGICGNCNVGTLTNVTDAGTEIHAMLALHSREYVQIRLSEAPGRFQFPQDDFDYGLPNSESFIVELANVETAIQHELLSE